MRISKRDFLGKALFILFSLSWCYADILDNQNDNFKYIFAILNMIIILMEIIINKKKFKELFFYKEAKSVFCFALFSLLISFFIQLLNFSFSPIVFKEFFYLLFPIFYAFLLLNNNEKKDLDFYFNCIFFIHIISFLYKFGQYLNLENIFSISFNNSYSIFESAYSTIFLQLFIYYFIRKKPLFYIASGFLCFLSLKRLDFLFLLVFPIIYLFSINKRFSRKTIFLIKAIFILSPFVMMTIYSKEFSNFLYTHFNFNLNNFTTGRYRLVNYITNGNFQTNGLGSIQLYLQNLTGETDVHCDMIKILFETTIIGVFLFVNNYFNVVKKNMLLTIILVYLFITMSFSHCITSLMVWFLFFMTSGYVLKNEKENKHEES